ncbi:MAG TPA: hypothetical protein VFI47_22570 [Acidimicrobiales bacterium]|nr:hypothetical protein [Acidimicrobiales bacterium]
MRTRSRIVAAVALALAAAASAVGCSTGEASPVASSSVPPQDLPACEEIYKQGAKVEVPFGIACVKDGKLISPQPTDLECTDGRRLLYNDLAWGFLGDVMTLTPDDDVSKAPENAVDECLSPSAVPVGPPSS